MIGLFGLSEVLRSVHSRAEMAAPAAVGGDRTSAREVAGAIWRNKGTVVRSSLLGTLVGALPGAGADIAAWVAYGLAQRISRRPQEFGQGAEVGVIAPTSANNAAVGGAWIPALVLGIPGDSVTAIVLGALLVYNIKPGPLIFVQNADQIRSLMLIALVTQVLLIPCGYAGIRAFGWILRLPRSVVMTGVVVFSVLGAYALRSSLFDVWLMLVFGVLGFWLESQRVPLAPLILGMILGPMVEENLRVGLIKTDGDWLPFFTRPISGGLFCLLMITLLVPALVRIYRRFSPTPPPRPTDPPAA
jgi:TctA family transporter